MIETVKPKNVKWVDTYITKTHDNPPMESQYLYKMKLPDWLAIWDVFAGWEFEHVLSMREHLKEGDILFDIGAEIGWQSVLFSKMVGAKNMVLIEPSSELWPNIKATWEKNCEEKPLHCYDGFFSDKTTSNALMPLHLFPLASKGSLVKSLSYRNISEHSEPTQITLDDYVKATGIIPNALTIDVEGAELLVLQGAEQTLKNYDLKIWLSIHPELIRKNYNVGDSKVHDFMHGLGYEGCYLAAPSEEHWYFKKEKK
jgi:FkbM family methyltransferase